MSTISPDSSCRAGNSAGAESRTRSATPFPLADAKLAHDVSGHTGKLVEVDDDWLDARDVQHWMGPRSLPLWLPREMTGFSTRSNAAYRAAGGGLRGVRETLERTLADERERGLDRERRSGLTRAEETSLIDELR